jgi:hypothetical protein
MGEVVFSIGNRGYVGSGFGNYTFSNEFWEYNPETDTWSQKADIPGIPRSGASGFSIGNCGYIGLGMAKAVIYNDFWEYHQPSDTWRQITDCGYSSTNAFSMTIDGKGYVGAGISYPSCDFWEYTPDFSNVHMTERASNFSVFPNPVSDNLMINTDTPIIQCTAIYNSLGQIVYKSDINNHAIDVSGLTTGVYWIVCHTPDCVLKRVFIKE